MSVVRANELSLQTGCRANRMSTEWQSGVNASGILKDTFLATEVLTLLGAFYFRANVLTGILLL